MERTDVELYERARTGDAGALANLIERHLPQLHAFVRLRLDRALRARESSMDVVQSVCRELLAHGAGFEFRGDDRFRAWLFTSALNKIREKHRFHHFGKRDLGREQDAVGDDGSAQRVAAYLTPSMEAIGRESAAALLQALDSLSDDHREVITMARVVKLPHAVIGEVMGRSEEAVRQLLARALIRLTQELRARGVTLS
jgi:RNA polymerase sigma-70 factor (subfamily 1)